MAKQKERDAWQEILLILSWPQALTYLIFLTPGITRMFYEGVSTPVRVYWLISGVIFAASLIGYMKWKKIAAYGIIGVFLLDGIASLVFMDEVFNFLINMGFALLWALALRNSLKHFN